ncbi:MAG: hypothetical protein HZB47_03480 [Nitrosomonadales bacterium]|nr:hypothetical protein [Nitrosomonadales bacterium]
MQLPFTVEQFFDVIRAYNLAVWPVQVVLLAFAAAAIALVVFPQRWSGVGISLILATLWAWLGLVYHLAFFTPINPLAYAFAAISVAGAAVFFWQGVVWRRLEFRWVTSARAVIGLGLVVFALVAYPAWSSFSGHGYPALPTFGLPCPTTLFTIGLLAFVAPPYPRSTLVAPVLWCFVGAQAAVLFGVHADLGLVVAGLFGIVLLIRSRGVTAPPSAAP